MDAATPLPARASSTPLARSAAPRRTPVATAYETTQQSPEEVGVFSLVKDEIYRDVALFITANEGRPQFLQDLFGLLQGCASDYARQRCLNALGDVIASVLPVLHSAVLGISSPVYLPTMYSVL